MEAAGTTCYRARVSLRRTCLVTGAAFLGSLAWPRAARADVSSWLFVGGGASSIDRSPTSRDVAPGMELDAGLGLPPSYDVVPGLLFRMNTRFGSGSDLAALIRTASGGYARGKWGAAIDLGGYERWWGDAPAPGFEGTLSLGAPWGITLNLDFRDDVNGVRTYAVALGLDLARFTIYRSSGLAWWSNPYPSPPPSGRER